MVRTHIRKAIFAIALISGTVTLQGCPLVLLGAAGSSILMATDRRILDVQAADRRIQIRAATLFTHHLPPDAHVSVTVFNQRVLLTGQAPHQAIRQRAEIIVRNIAGVHSIVNEIAIAPADRVRPRSNDAYLTAKVKTALIHDKVLSANSIKVVTDYRTVYLMGLVTTEEGRRAADIASRIRGITKVVKVFQYISRKEADRRSLNGRGASRIPVNQPAR